MKDTRSKGKFFRQSSAWYLGILVHAQVKQHQISSTKNLVYGLPQELLNDTRLGILRNEEVLGKFQNHEGTKSSVSSKCEFLH